MKRSKVFNRPQWDTGTRRGATVVYTTWYAICHCCPRPVPYGTRARGILFLTVVICLLLLATGCAPSPVRDGQVHTEKPAKPGEQKPELTVEPRPSSVLRPPSSDEGRAGVEPQWDTPRGILLTLKFTPQDLTTYKAITEAQRSIKGEGALANDRTFKGGATSNRIETTFTQQIKSVDDKGNAVAEITIKWLKFLSVEKNNTVLDFDSSREPDLNNPLGALIGQSYTIEITPDGQVSKIIDVNQAMAAFKGISSANETAKQILSHDAIKERHAIPALPACDKNQLHTSDSWSSIKTFSFGMMGSKSFERIYTLKEITDVKNHQIAIIDMNAIPSSEMVEEQHKEQAMGIFSKMFDSTDTYTGQMQLDLNAGKVKEYFEKLQSEWTAVDPSAGQEGGGEPAALRMTATRLHRIEKID